TGDRDRVAASTAMHDDVLTADGDRVHAGVTVNGAAFSGGDCVVAIAAVGERIDSDRNRVVVVFSENDRRGLGAADDVIPSPSMHDATPEGDGVIATMAIDHIVAGTAAAID